MRSSAGPSSPISCGRPSPPRGAWSRPPLERLGERRRGEPGAGGGLLGRQGPPLADAQPAPARPLAELLVRIGKRLLPSRQLDILVALELAGLRARSPSSDTTTSCGSGWPCGYGNPPQDRCIPARKLLWGECENCRKLRKNPCNRRT
jgi:hypothetical protein